MKKHPNFQKTVMVICSAVIAYVILTNSKLMADVTIVANSSITDDSIAASDIASIFLGKKKNLPSGDKVKIVTLKSGDVHDEFLGKYVNKTSSQFSAFWKRKIVDGTGIPPKSFNSEDELVEYVKSNANTIGYVSTNLNPPGVKGLIIN